MEGHLWHPMLLRRIKYNQIQSSKLRLMEPLRTKYGRWKVIREYVFHTHLPWMWRIWKKNDLWNENLFSDGRQLVVRLYLKEGELLALLYDGLEAPTRTRFLHQFSEFCSDCAVGAESWCWISRQFQRGCGSILGTCRDPATMNADDAAQVAACLEILAKGTAYDEQCRTQLQVLAHDSTAVISISRARMGLWGSKTSDKKSGWHVENPVAKTKNMVAFDQSDRLIFSANVTLELLMLGVTSASNKCRSAG